jgi:ribonucleoside-diphosphate reductase alpha chain
MKSSNFSFNDDFSQEVWFNTYKYHTDETLEDTVNRVAGDLASVEGEHRERWFHEFKGILADFQFVPGGRILSNAGTGLKRTTMINCFVSAPGGKDLDSVEGILRERAHCVKILASEGGYGFCADFMRPRGAMVNGIGVEGPGAVKWLEAWSKDSEVVTAGSGEKKKTDEGKNKIRKGAMMVTMSCWHPSIEEFIVAKQVKDRLDKFNMSVLVTDAFMDAVKKHKPWKLEFPDTKDERYEEHWTGDLKAWKKLGGTVVLWKEYADANELWDLIMRSTYGRNEPGVLFIDTINRLNNLWYCEHISATNPCGEQVLPPGGVCLLGSLNLTQFIKDDDWDYDKLTHAVAVAVRMMDNVNDKTFVPLPEQRKNLKEKRRIGLGYLGYGSALMMMKVRYGSPRAKELTENLASHVANEAYRASALLAKEKGAFPLFDKHLYLNSEFLKNIDSSIRALIEKHGIRNSHLLSIQPTGNTSVFANNISSGLEPVINPEYVRTAIIPYLPDGLRAPPLIEWADRFHTMHKDEAYSKWSWIKEGDEHMLRAEHGDAVYKIDKNRGYLKESKVRDYAVRYLDLRDEWDSKAPWAASALDGLTIDEHVNTMSWFADYIDSAMSKTVNIPKDYPYEEFKHLYMRAYDTRTIKGCTTYREGTMASVLSKEGSKAEVGPDGLPTRIKQTDAPKRPKELPCEVHRFTANGVKWLAFVGLLEGDPFEVFAFPADKLPIALRPHAGTSKGVTTRKARGRYDITLDDGTVFEDIRQYSENRTEEAIGRLLSLSLRHGAAPEFAVTQLGKTGQSMIDFPQAAARVLKKYITVVKSAHCTECGSKKIVMQEGCSKCADCGSSKCG